MPYIEDLLKRLNLDETANRALLFIKDVGDLNYAITTLLLKYTKREGKRYFTIVVVMGTLLCVALEYYRRLAAPYEDEKAKINGDCY
jgi:hypothetical protein